MRGLVSTLLALGAGAGAMAAFARGTSQPTVIAANVTPFTSDGHLRHGLRVVRQVRGSCGPGSDVLPNNVYRCGFGNFIVDPCWREYRV